MVVYFHLDHLSLLVDTAGVAIVDVIMQIVFGCVILVAEVVLRKLQYLKC